MSLADIIAAQAAALAPKAPERTLQPWQMLGTLPPGFSGPPQQSDADAVWTMPMDGGVGAAIASDPSYVLSDALGITHKAQTDAQTAVANEDQATRDKFAKWAEGFGQGPAPGDQTFTIDGVPMPAFAGGGGGMPAYRGMDTSVIRTDTSAADAAMERARPKPYAADPQDETWGWMQGLAAAAANVGPDAPLGQMLLQLGAGMIAGRGQARSANKEAMMEAEAAQRQYEMQAAGWEFDKARMVAQEQAQAQQLKNQEAMQRMEYEFKGASIAAENSRAAYGYAKEMAALAQPQFVQNKDGSMTMTQFNPATGQHTFKRFGAEAMNGAISAANTTKQMGGGFGDVATTIADMRDLPPQMKIATLLAIAPEPVRTDILGPEAYQLYNQKLAELLGTDPMLAAADPAAAGNADAYYAGLSGEQKNARATELRNNLILDIVMNNPQVMERMMQYWGPGQ